ncbi:hypothetical protein PoB_003626400 [Plakobranchus ocellatus]|uniref:Uncharacterized protein n=1 Tax=Plakobranchus ocellatus TaxID=259542 RepID=A0AAV4ATT8_9GAST|nr:hypothetical protein PoB_003626400 [Plakobranchus ocellatus]
MDGTGVDRVTLYLEHPHESRSRDLNSFTFFSEYLICIRERRTACHRKRWKETQRSPFCGEIGRTIVGQGLDSTAAGNGSKGACHSGLSHSRSKAPGFECHQRRYLVEGQALGKTMALVWCS